MKRNYMQVGNTTYFKSSIQSKNSIIVVEPGIHTIVNNSVGQAQPLKIINDNIKNKDAMSIKVNSIFLNVELKAEKEYKELGSIFVPTNDLTQQDKIYDFKKVELNNVNNNTFFACMVFSKKDKYFEPMSKSIYVRDIRKDQGFTVLESPCVELNNIIDASHVISCKTSHNISKVSNFSNNIKGNWKDFNEGSDTIEKTLSTVVRLNELTLFNAVDTFTIVTESQKTESGYESKEIIAIEVADKNSGMNSDDLSSSGGDLKRMDFKIQQMSFFEFKLNFDKNKVSDIVNLPQGLFFDKEGQRIIGTPMVSGKFTFTIIFEDTTTLIGSIDVPKINREL